MASDIFFSKRLTTCKCTSCNPREMLKRNVKDFSPIVKGIFMAISIQCSLLSNKVWFDLDIPLTTSVQVDNASRTKVLPLAFTNRLYNTQESINLYNKSHNSLQHVYCELTPGNPHL